MAEIYNLSDVISNPSMDGKEVIVQGIPRGVVEMPDTPDNKQWYMGFLETAEGDPKQKALLEITGFCGDVFARRAVVSMLEASSGSGIVALVEGTVRGPPPYQMQVTSVRLSKYEFPPPKR